MEKTFVEDLWDKDPVLVTNSVKRIFNVKEKIGDKLVFLGKKNGALVFEKYGHCPEGFVLRDFGIDGYNFDSRVAEEWRTVMFEVYGTAYAMQLISQRNMQLDKFMAKYKENYNTQTRNALDNMGFNYEKTK